MNELNITLNPKDILNKSFNFSTRGYAPEEVDAYLDLVMGDYREFVRFIKLLDGENTKLLEEVNRLKAELRNLKMQFDSVQELSDTGGFTTTNVDLLRRLSNLEKTVYGKDE